MIAKWLTNRTKYNAFLLLLLVKIIRFVMEKTINQFFSVIENLVVGGFLKK